MFYYKRMVYVLFQKYVLRHGLSCLILILRKASLPTQITPIKPD